jgi:DNA gyrase subunit A
MAGIKLASGARAVFFGALNPRRTNLVVTSSGSSAALPGTEPGSLKVTPYSEYPAKGRATGGVRCHRFLRGEDTLVLGWAGGTPARAAAANGVALDLPAPTGKRDGSGLPIATAIAAIAGALPEPRSTPAPTAPMPGPEPDGPEMLPEFPAGRE